MRQVKFRAWNGKELFNVDVMAISECTWDCPDNGKRGVSLAYQPHIQVMQFTGLKDKNDREIYEGDIWYDGHFPRVIKYDEEYAGFLPFVTDGGCGCCSEGGTGYRESDGEIIGNIYENPEILEAK